MWAMRMTCKELATSLEVLLSKLQNMGGDAEADMFSAMDFIASMFASSANAAAVNGVSVPYTMRDGYDWIEIAGISSDELQASMKAMVEAIGSIMGNTNTTTEPTANDDPKKNEVPLTLSN
jgi:hypothetical protein